MPGTFTQIYIQVVFAVKGRQSLIASSWEEELYKYISGIITRKDQKMLAINGMPDHIHFFIGMRPTCCLSDLVREVKECTNEFITEKKLWNSNFHWQEGYGAFSYSHSHIDNVIRYIMNQKRHHRKQTFKNEYLELLRKFNVEFNEKYLFEWIE